MSGQQTDVYSTIRLKEPGGIRTLEALQHHVRIAVQVEHFTIPLYLSALFSMKEDENRDSQQIIRSVVMEEMLHMSLAINLLNAIGGKFTLLAKGAPHQRLLPHYGKDGRRLPHAGMHERFEPRRFSSKQVDAFMAVEQPAQDGAQPEPYHYETIGQFYAAIRKGLDTVWSEIHEDLFAGSHKNGDRQVGREHYYGGGGELFPVTDMCSARQAIDQIVDQGEGFVHGKDIGDGDQSQFGQAFEVAHFYRFQQIQLGRYYAEGDDPGKPQGRKFKVDWDAVYPMRSNPRRGNYPSGSPERKKMTEFAHLYSDVLRDLQRAFNGRPDELASSVGRMYQLRYAAQELCRTPAGSGNKTLGPPFQFIPSKKEREKFGI